MSHKLIDPPARESLLTGWILTLDQQPLLTDEILPAMKIGWRGFLDMHKEMQANIKIDKDYI